MSLPVLKNKLLWFFLADLALLLVFLAAIYWLWKALPDEAVKLHGTVENGVDLLGTKNDVLWIGGLALLVFLVNSILAGLTLKREKIASLYLLVATMPIMAIFIGVIAFLADLNKI